MSNSALAAGLRHLRNKLAAQQPSSDSDEQLLHVFISRRDDNAFAALMRRHGPMVLHVCRRVLGHEQDAEDAFQATFLVLAKSAASLRKKSSLASFLHGVAYRIALKIKQSAARRREHESQTPAHPPADPADELSWREIRTLLDEEIHHLPEKYRTVFVLYYLEDHSREETARRLGLKDATVAKRLVKARKRLSQRLARRGVELTAVLTAMALAQQSASALPAGLMAATIQAAVSDELSGIVSVSVAGLVQEATRAMMMSKAKIATMVLLAVSFLAVATSGSLVCWYEQASGPLAATVLPPAAKAKDKPKAPKRTEIQGRVLDPEGKPKAGAKLLLLDKDVITELGVTGADGRFAGSVPKSGYLIAHASSTGIDFVELFEAVPKYPVELRLVKDHPIRGRIVNTEGKPVAGVRVWVNSINVYAQNSLESFLIGWQNRSSDFVLPAGEKNIWFRANSPFADIKDIERRSSLFTSLTDADGRFAISGIGAERVAQLDVYGGGIANTALWIVNHAGIDVKPLNQPASVTVPGSPPKMLNPPSVGMALRGPNASVVVEPEKPIRGIVKDADSGKGVPNVEVRLEQDRTIPPTPFVTARTDSQGRYEFRGARKTKTYPFHVDSDSSAGYLATQVRAADTVGFSPLNVDIRIKKGVIVTGKIIDRATGKSVTGFAQFAVLINNPIVKDYPPFHSGIVRKRDYTAADGTFRVAVIPGPVLLMGGYYPRPSDREVHDKFDYIEFSKYRPPITDPEYPQYFRNVPTMPGSRRNPPPGYLNYGGGLGLIQGNYCKVLDIKPGTAIVHQDVFLDRASVLEVKIEDGDGRPVVGVWATDFATGSFIGPLWIERATCPVYGLEARKPRMLIFYEPKKKIIGSRKLQGDEKGPITVTLGPMGAAKGRLIDADGKPLAGVVVTEAYRESEAEKLHWDIHYSKQVATDAAGAFTLEELIPDVKFDLSIHRGKRRFQREPKSAETTIQVKPGECRDLGAIKLKEVAGRPNN